MQTTYVLRPLPLWRRFQRWMARPLEESQTPPDDADIPDYLRRDVGLMPRHRKPAGRANDPPPAPPFRLL